MLFLLSAESFLGKVDKHSLSQETLLELLVEGFTTHKEIICGPEENPRDTSEWYRVKRNSSKDVIKIDWSGKSLEGSIDLKWLPLALKKLYLQVNRLTGTADLTCLPEDLETFSISDNLFHGTIDLTQLPGRLSTLYLYKNSFSGRTDFSELPGSLKYLNISATTLEGEVFHFSGYLLVDGSNVKDKR